MNDVVKEIVLLFDKESPQPIKSNIRISVENDYNEDDQYKFMVGLDGVWTTLLDFGSENNCVWTPKENGKYLVMVQIKHKDSKKPFDEILKQDFIVGTVEEKLIKAVYIDKSQYSIGEKVDIEVETTKLPSMFRYWVDGKDGWQLIKDYSSENKIKYTCNEDGKHQLLIECKVPYSKNNFDDFRTIDFEVKKMDKLGIIDYKCLTNDLLTGEDLVFEVETDAADERTVLFKFIKIDNDGRSTCIQDFSSRKMVSFIEDKPGKYKLLCMAKDMYSEHQYDDRAIIVYEVIPYYPVKITNFTTDVCSPQAAESKINIKTIAEGGKNLLYKFRIDGPYAENSGYLRGNTFLWNPKQAGDYKVTVFVKDESFDGRYEADASFDFMIQEKPKRTVNITNIALDKDDNYIINQPVNIMAEAEGSNDIRYSFIIYKNEKETERVRYSTTNWVNFTPETPGQYSLEIRVKDKYSDKDFDAHSYVYFDVKEYMPGKIEHILLPSKEHFLVGDTIDLECITLNSKETLIKYVTKVDEMVVEETDFIEDKKFSLRPKRAGKYKIEMYVKNVKCKNEFDTKKEIRIVISEAQKITGTKITCDNTRPRIDEEVNFTVSNDGGKDVCYEFYIMHNGNWSLVQNYSRKNYYTFRPFDLGDFRLLVLAKSYYKRCSYEDYDEFKFEVTDTNY